MAFDFSSLIIDRKPSDVGKNPKGSYNYTDLNRVEDCMAFLVDKFRTFGYACDYTPGKRWAVEDIPTAPDMDLYLRNIKALRATLGTAAELPTTMGGLTTAAANQIEQLLLRIEDELEIIRLSWLYSGEIFAGEV